MRNVSGIEELIGICGGEGRRLRGRGDLKEFLKEPMNQLIIATWNLDTGKESLEQRADLFRVEMDKLKADVWVITEPLLRFSPGVEYELVAHTRWASDLELVGKRWSLERRWVGIWSKLPARKVEVLREPDRMACIRIEQDGQRDVVIVGTVLPWNSDRQWKGKNGKKFCDALNYQAVEWKRLWGNPQVSRVLCRR